MPRIRSVKPEIRRSLTVAEWPREVRLAWVYLWMYLDDEGRGLDDMRLVVAELFPLDRDVTEKKMDKWLQLMATTKTSDDDTPPLCRYEVQGRRYLHAVNWQHQKINRPQDSRLPPCPIHDGHSESNSEPITEPFTESNSEPSLPDSPPSRAPADRGSGSKGSREHGSGNAPAGAVASIVRAYVAACPHPPAEALQARIEKQARTLIAEGHDIAAITTAAANAARGGWNDLAVQMQRDALRTSPSAGGNGAASLKAQGWLNVDQQREQPAIGGAP